MQTRSSDENSVGLYVCLSVWHTHGLWPWMTFNGTIALTLYYSTEFDSSEGYYVTVVEDRHILCAEYRLALLAKSEPSCSFTFCKLSSSSSHCRCARFCFGCNVKILAGSVCSTTNKRSTREQVLVNLYTKCTPCEETKKNYDDISMLYMTV